MSSAVEDIEDSLDIPSVPGTATGLRPEGTDSLVETIIERRPGWHFIDLREMWRNRELLYFLVWRDVKVRYKQTVLGAGWAILQPLATMVIFTICLGRMGKMDEGIPHYPLFVFAGILPWMFFANAIGSAGQSIVGNQSLVTKVYFPRLIIPMSSVGVALVDFVVALSMMIGLMVYYQVPPSWSILLAPLVLLCLIVAALGVGTLLSALTVAYRDFRHVVPFMVQIWMFATPCIYLQADKVIGPRTATFMPLNPAYGLIAAFRQCMLGEPIDLYSLMVSLAVSLALLLCGCLYFRRVERSFADII